jgi:RND family efflux transporter MFP subunit
MNLQTITWALLISYLSLPLAAASDEAVAIEGVLKPNKQVTLNSPLSAVIAEIPVVEGQRVTRGTLLVQMDDELQRVALQSAEAEAQSNAAIEVARLGMVEAQLQVQRLQRLAKADAAADWELEQMQTRAAQAAAEYRRTQDAQALAHLRTQAERVRLDRHRVKAPFDGEILRIDAEAGASKQPEDALLTLVSLSKLKAEFYFPSTVYGRIAVGDAVKLQIEHPRFSDIDAEVLTLDPVIDPASLTFRVVFEVDNTPYQLPAGLSVTYTPPAEDYASSR